MDIPSSFLTPLCTPPPPQFRYTFPRPNWTKQLANDTLQSTRAPSRRAIPVPQLMASTREQPGYSIQPLAESLANWTGK